MIKVRYSIAPPPRHRREFSDIQLISRRRNKAARAILPRHLRRQYADASVTILSVRDCLHIKCLLYLQ